MGAKATRCANSKEREGTLKTIQENGSEKRQLILK